MADIHPAVCSHDCYDTCSVELTVNQDRIVRVNGSRRQPLTRNFVCYKVHHAVERVNHPDRVLYPLKRVGAKGQGTFQRVSWEQALSDVTERLQKIRDTVGGEAILPYSYSGNMGVLGEASMDRRVFHALGASELERTICTGAADWVLTAMFGQRLGPDPETIPDARLILLWGTNPMATNIHQVPLLDQAVQNGAQIIVVDPLKTATAERYGHHVAIRPGTDDVLALSLGQALIRQNRHHQPFIARYTRGFEAYRREAEAWPLERAAEVTGVSLGVLESLVDQLATIRPLLIRPGFGVQRHRRGGRIIWALAALAAITGAFMDRGGGFLLSNSGAFALARDRLTRPDLKPGTVRKVNMVQLGRALTELTDPPIQALIVYNSNPAATAPYQRRVLEGLAREDLLTVVHDSFMTDTARYADYVFPAAMSWEIGDLHLSYWHRYWQWNRPAVAPPGEAVSNPEFFRRLARALHLTDPALVASDDELLEDALEGYPPEFRSRLRDQGVMKAGPKPEVRPFVDTPILTDDGRIHLEPPPAGKPVDDVNSGPFVLVSPSARETIKSSYGNLPRVIKGPPVLWMNPEDMSRQGLQDGEWVRVYNHRGQTVMQARSSELPRPGVVVSYAVRWLSDHPFGGNVNQLTPDELSDVGGGATFYDARVAVEKWAGGSHVD
ncbi:MAG: molybdopterin-dependent oxidoreductase [Sulfobacillus sp.]|nr:molybdopterin-dependent oxidoreductase [Sulfobacillus sp.]